MRYFITGGAGFIGSNYIEYLSSSTVANASKITVFDKFTYAANPKNLQSLANDERLNIVVGDVRDKDHLNSSMRNHDFVIHFAAESHVDRSIADATDFVETNIVGSANVFEASLQNDVSKVVHVSTDEVYGSLEEGGAKESFPLKGNSPYAASKAASDLLALSFFVTHGLDVIITRCCNNYGKFQFPEKIIPFFIKELSAGRKVPIYGEGTNIREWIHVSDHARAIQLVLNHGSPGEIYNIGSGLRLSNNELTDRIIKVMGLGPERKEYVIDRKGHDFRYALDSSKIMTLGFKPKKEFDSGLDETIKWYLLNSEWWNSNDQKD